MAATSTPRYCGRPRIGRPLTTSAPTDWRHQAICHDKDIDPELFFPLGASSGADLLQIEQAKAVCRDCPACPECLAWALDTGQDAGVWGGMSEEERRAYRRNTTRRASR